MARTADKDKHYLLVKIDGPRDSRINTGRLYWRLTWFCVEDADYWDMTIDDSYQNFKRFRWQDFLDREQYGLYSGLRRTQRQTGTNRNVLTADVQPELLQEAPQATVIESAKEITDAVKRVNTYTDLFETE